jgi:Fanconi-associated nuclease 1
MNTTMNAKWRRGKRGAWYDRLALILMNHYGGDLDKKREAVEVCLDALEDNDTHLSERECVVSYLGCWAKSRSSLIVYRPRLSRRLKRLERQLELSKEERHICEADLGQPEKRFLKAHRIRTQAREASTLRSFFASKRDGTSNGSGDEQDYSNEGRSNRDDSRSSKTTWLGREGVTGVEAWVLEWWIQEGWQGQVETWMLKDPKTDRFEIAVSMPRRQS